MAEDAELTRLLNQLRSGDPEAQRAFEDHVYQRLKRIAAKAMSAERANHTLQPTALVHEFVAQMYEQEMPSWVDRAHFFHAAARKMRLLLVDHARGRKAAKRGAGDTPIPLEDELVVRWEDPDHILALEEGMKQLEARFPEEAHVIELSAYAGLQDDEIASAMSVNRTTVQRHKRFARAFLAKRVIGAPRAGRPDKA